MMATPEQFNPEEVRLPSAKRLAALAYPKKGWGNYKLAGSPDVHTIPLHDLEEHRLDAEKCTCEPIRPYPDFPHAVRHFAFDGRHLIEALEAGEKIA